MPVFFLSCKCNCSELPVLECYLLSNNINFSSSSVARDASWWQRRAQTLWDGSLCPAELGHAHGIRPHAADRHLRGSHCDWFWLLAGGVIQLHSHSCFALKWLCFVMVQSCKHVSEDRISSLQWTWTWTETCLHFIFSHLLLSRPLKKVICHFHALL